MMIKTGELWGVWMWLQCPFWSSVWERIQESHENT